MRRKCSMTSLAIVAFGCCVQADAQALCPELTRLRSEAQDALKQARIVPADERCFRYNRLSQAWDAVAQFASDNREACRVSTASLNDFELYHRQAVKDRGLVCTGRPLRPYGADVIQH